MNPAVWLADILTFYYVIDSEYHIGVLNQKKQ